jgi:hypothetical protein
MRARILGSCGVALFCLVAASCSGKSKTDGGSPIVGAAGASAVSGSGSGGGDTTGSSGTGTGNSANGSAGTGFTPIIPDAGPDDGATEGGLSGDVCGTTCPSGGTCSPEICDGIDNNCDGQIDNVDKNNDGVCDCLLIATLGVKGTWGTGDVFATWLSARSNVGAVDLADQTLTPDLLAKYQVIVAQDVHQNHVYADSEVQALQAWVQAGGGFMTLIGYSTPPEPTNVNLLLAPFSMSYDNTQILPKPRNGGNTTVPITEWTPHPIDLGVTAVGVDDGYPPKGMGTVIATGGGNNVGLAQEVGKGHVFLWGDEWITYNSEWTQHPDYQVELFWVNAIKWLTAASTCQVPIPPTIPR